MNNEFSADVIIDGDNAVFDIGQSLKNKRNLLNLTEKQIANHLKIPVEQVCALEDNRFDYFRSKTFARGYLKGYVRLLQLEETPVMAAFDSLYIAVEPPLAPVDKVNKQAHLTDPIVLFVSFVLVAVLVFLVFWWPTTNEPENVMRADSPVTETNAETPDVSTTLIPNDSASTASGTIEPITTSTETDVATGLSEETLALLQEVGIDQIPVVPPVQDEPKVTDSLDTTPKVLSYVNEIEMRFSADCWTEIRDNKGQILFSGVKSAGSTLELSGEAPFRVVLGFARGVSSLKFKGQDFDFSSFIRRDLARFELK